MPIVTLNAYSKAFPQITNRIRASVSLESSPLAIIDSIIDDTPGHPERVWTFSDLQRDTYRFSLDEIDGPGNVLQNLALFTVSPGEIEGATFRADEQIQVDDTPNFISGASSATFDGSNGSPDYRGWEIVPSELNGRGILVRGLDYSWDKTTGTLALLIFGDIFMSQTFFNIHFNPMSLGAIENTPRINDMLIFVATATSAITADMFGHKLIVNSLSPYVELTLPPIATIPDGRRLMIEVNSETCVRVLKSGSENISFLRGNLFILNKESISVYRRTISTGLFEWRCCDESGNFRNVGQITEEDFTQLGVINEQALDGTIGNSNGIHARIYRELVLNLPLNQVVNFSDWTTGNNRYLYSFADANGNFRFPDRRGLFSKSTPQGGKAGTYEADSIGPHRHFSIIDAQVNDSRFPYQRGSEMRKDDSSRFRTFIKNWFKTSGGAEGYVSDSLTTEPDISRTSNPYDTSGATETKPKNISTNKFVVI